MLKGVEEILRKIFHVMLNSKSSSEAIGNVIQFSQFFSDRDEVLLVNEEFVLTEELGIC